MTNGFDPAEGLQYRRVPDNGLFPPSHRLLVQQLTVVLLQKINTSSPRPPTSRGGTIEIHNHLKARHVAAEPRASEATYEDYKRTQEKPRK
jgi:hypothetical protein